MNILFLDLETTGTESDCNNIIQIAAEFHQDGKLVSSFNKKLEPLQGSKIAIGALAVNGYRFANRIVGPDSLMDSVTISEYFADFLAECKSKAGYNPIFICGHNVRFDIDFIKPFLEKNNITGFSEIISYKVLDTATIGTFLIEAGRIDLEKFNLQQLAEYFKVNVIEEGGDALVNASFHDAAYDTKITAKVYYAMIDLIKG